MVPLFIALANSEYSGQVKDSNGNGLADAVVYLASDTEIRDTTSAGGAFSLTVSTSIFGKSGKKMGSYFTHFRLNQSQLKFNSNIDVSNLSIKISNSQGRKVMDINLAQLNSGEHSIKVPQLNEAIYLVTIQADGHKLNGKIFAANINHEFSVAMSQDLLKSVASAAAIDSLIVEKEGYKTTSYALEAESETGIEITLEKELTLPPVEDYSAMGPYSTVVERNVGPGNGYIVFRPETMGENGFLHAPIVFGPGINQTVEPIHNTLLTHFASHGFVVVGTPVLSEGPYPGDGNTRTMETGLEWILGQNTVSGSKFEGKIWTDRAVAMGFSVGGTAAVNLGAKEEIFTTVSIHGHDLVPDLKGPMLQLNGSADVSFGQPTFDASNVQTFLATRANTAHTYIEKDGGGSHRPAIIAWMRYWIYGDEGGKHYFYGDDCVLCKDPYTNPQRKNWDE